MLSHCANSECSKPFLQVRDGKLFLVETGRPENSGHSRTDGVFHARALQPRIDRFWLCDECAILWTLIYDREQGIQLAPLPQPVATVPLPVGVSGRGAGVALLKRVALPVTAKPLPS